MDVAEGAGAAEEVGEEVGVRPLLGEEHAERFSEGAIGAEAEELLLMRGGWVPWARANMRLGTEGELAEGSGHVRPKPKSTWMLLEDSPWRPTSTAYRLLGRARGRGRRGEGAASLLRHTHTHRVGE